MILKPEDFENYNELIFCSNYIKNYKKIITIKEYNYEPLIIKKGEDGSPLVFIKGYIPEEDRYIPIISGNKVEDDRLKFFSSPTGCILNYITTILEVVKNERDIMEVTRLDLRPLGFNIYGDTKSLNLGGNALNRGSITDTETFISV